MPYVDFAYDERVRSGWTQDGAIAGELREGASVVFSHAPFVAADVEGITFRFKADAALGELIEARVDSAKTEVFPRVKIGPQHRRTVDGWEEVVVTITELNPQSHAFDRIVLRTLRKATVTFAKVGVIEKQPASAPTTKSTEPRLFAIDCFAKSHKISPLIYGIALNPRLDKRDSFLWKLNPTTRRWGGNPASRYNWEHGSAWNTAADYFFKNVNYAGGDWGYPQFFRDNLAHGVTAALTVPMLGWVAKDTQSVSFPVNLFGWQRATDPETHQAGDGYTREGKALTPLDAERTSIPAPPEFVGRWITDIHRRDAEQKFRNVSIYMLDNEPELWNDTHRDVHPAPLTYDELLDRTLKYGEAVRNADKDAVIAGYASWGYTGYFYSAADAAAGVENKPDRLAHGDMPLMAWYLQQLKAHEDKGGTHILDHVDVHFYPAAKGVFGEKEQTDALTNALRIRSTRALWDPGYTDESWVKDNIRLIPRMKEWIAKYYPGRGVIIGEWNFGAEHHMSGALALAEALGRFGEQDVTAAYYWTYPPDQSPAFYAWNAFRNYDGKRSVFQDESLATRAPGGASLFASRNASGTKVTAVLLNFSATMTLDAQIDVGACGSVKERKTFMYAGGPDGFSEQPAKKQESGAVRETIPPYSITVLSLDVVRPSQRQ